MSQDLSRLLPTDIQGTGNPVVLNDNDGFTTVVNNRHARSANVNVGSEIMNEQARPMTQAISNAYNSVAAKPASTQQQSQIAASRPMNSNQSKKKERAVGAADVSYGGIRAAKKMSLRQSVFCINNLEKHTSCETVEAYLTFFLPNA